MKRRDLLTRAVGAFSVCLVAPTVAMARQRRHVWPGGARAAVSLTYDDGLDSQLDNVVPALNKRGLKATFFLTQENMEERLEDWQAVSRQGHEIADHSVHHPCGLSEAKIDDFERDEIAGAETFLDANFQAGRVPIYAYPCGGLNIGKGGPMKEQLRYVRALKRHVAFARAADGEPNDPRDVARRRYVLQAVAPTYEKDDPALVLAYVRGAMRTGHWAILIFHAVIEKRVGDGDTSIAHHELVLDWLQTQDAWCAPMGEVLKGMRLSRA
jgi:peptidoglycan/xylan/chitin deacetylase (PgdA/CDA1 family)